MEIREISKSRNLSLSLSPQPQPQNHKCTNATRMTSSPKNSPIDIESIPITSTANSNTILTDSTSIQPPHTQPKRREYKTPTITVFSTPGCHACLMVKKMLASALLPYSDEDVSQNIQGFKSFTQGSISVPQVSIDGKLLKTFEAFLQWYQEWQINHPISRPTSPDLSTDQKPTATTLAENSFLESLDEDSGENPNADVLTMLIEALLHPTHGVPREKKRQALFWVYDNAFTGNDLVSWLVKNGYLEHSASLFPLIIPSILSTKSLSLKNGIPRMVKLYPSEIYHICGTIGDILNPPRFPSQLCPTFTPLKLSQHLQKTMLLIQDGFFDGHGNIDYENLKKSRIWRSFLDLTPKLSTIDLSILNENQRFAFWINIYNVFVIHQIIVFGSPISSNSTLGSNWFTKGQYCLGGFNFTLNDIEHGVLRRNNRPVFGIWKPFSPTDPRIYFRVSKVDPRVHFALNCAKMSCPPIRVYSGDNLDVALDIASSSFVNSYKNVSLTKLDHNGLISWKLRLSKIFSWYSEDFGSKGTGGSIKDCVKFVSNYLVKDDNPDFFAFYKLYLRDPTGIPVQISYFPYDSRLNSFENAKISKKRSGSLLSKSKKPFLGPDYLIDS